ncbi:MAG: hypothetical protein P8H62_11200 [Henriciella sp.]|nr:hypothetical protein [Henriciella sp.]
MNTSSNIKSSPKFLDKILNAVAEMDTTEMDHVWNELRAVRERLDSLESLMGQDADRLEQAKALPSEGTE